MNIQASIKTFLEGEGKSNGRLPTERYSSFDYCFNYFQEFHETGRTAALADSKNMQQSCLQLGFYLASWGMLRGSSFLLEKSAKFYEGLIEAIAVCDERLWTIDVDSYTDENIDCLIDCAEQLRRAMGDGHHATDTLITKMMLGVFGNTPALDQFVRSSLRLYSFSQRSLRRLHEFYLSNKQEIDSYRIYTIDFKTGKETKRLYSKAKVIDMVGFIAGQR